MKKIIKLLFPKAYKEIYNDGYRQGYSVALYDYNDDVPEWSQEELDYHDEMYEEQMRWMREQADLEAEYNEEFYDSRPGDLYYDGE